MSVQYLKHTRTLFGLTILLNQLKLNNFQDRVNMLQGTCVLGVYCLFLDNAREMFGS